MPKVSTKSARRSITSAWRRPETTTLDGLPEVRRQVLRVPVAPSRLPAEVRDQEERCPGRILGPASVQRSSPIKAAARRAPSTSTGS